VQIDRRELLAIFCGGALGALLRAGLAEAAPTSPGRWPWPTLVVNVAGCFLLGFFATRLQERMPLSAYRRPFLGTGLCGALTTFATFQVELVHMVEEHHEALAAVYGATSIAAGFGALLVATSIVRRSRFAR
jgi:CrcB protein